MESSEFFLITAHDGHRWMDDEVVEQSPINRVRQLLGGRWERSKKYGEFIKVFFGQSEKRVLVMGFPPGKTKADVEVALKQIRESREDMS